MSVVSDNFATDTHTLGSFVRTHWSIVSIHWSLDVNFQQDKKTQAHWRSAQTRHNPGSRLLRVFDLGRTAKKAR